MPIVNQNHIFPSAGSQTGLRDTLQRLFFSPAKPTAVIILGIGPVFSLREQHAFLQSFLAYTTKDAWTFTVNTESAYDWRNRDLVGAA